MKRYAEIRTDYIDDTEVYIDTWETGDDNEEGHSVATVNIDNGQITWLDTNAEVISNPQIALAIAEIIKHHSIRIFP